MIQSGEVTNIVHVLRAERRWTQSDLAHELGVTRQTIAAIENGKYLPSLELAFEIAYVFDKNIQEVFIFTPYEEDYSEEEPK